MVYGSIADIFIQWEYIGVFDFILPFLLFFAIIFGIMSTIKFFGENKGVHVIIALVVSLMALRYQYLLSPFLAELFPRLGIGITMILALLILVGIFIPGDQKKYWGYGLAVIAGLTALVVIYQAFQRSGLIYGSGIDSETIGFIVLGLLIVATIVVIAREKNPTKTGKAKFLVPWTSED